MRTLRMIYGDDCDPDCPCKTSGGVELTDEKIQGLADEAERGYEPGQLSQRKTVIIADTVTQGKKYASAINKPTRSCVFISLDNDFHRLRTISLRHNKDVHFVGHEAKRIEELIIALKVSGYFD